ncbi:hypothetical protein [Roseomonas sp. USHLN139]|uniref:hypothetical protein n=1 Tax=Roseomonas sp. USHLN139 TaxID=3081298 RepID=UPI003B0213F0
MSATNAGGTVQWSAVHQAAAATAASVALETVADKATEIATEITERVAGEAGAKAGEDAAKPFALDALAAASAADLAQLAAQSERLAAAAAKADAMAAAGTASSKSVEAIGAANLAGQRALDAQGSMAAAADKASEAAEAATAAGAALADAVAAAASALEKAGQASSSAASAASSAAMLTDPSVAPTLVKNAAGTDVGTPFLFDDPTPAGSPRQAMTVASLPKTPWWDDLSGVRARKPKSAGGALRDEFDMNEEFEFQNNDSPADIGPNNEAWAAFTAHANAWNAANPGKRATYKVNKRQVWQFSNKAIIIPRCRLILNGTVMQYAGTASRSALHQVQAGVDVDTLFYYARSDFSWYRVATFGAVTDTDYTRIQDLRCDSDLQFVNRPSNGNGFDIAFYVFQGNIWFGNVEWRRQDYGMGINDSQTTIRGVTIDQASTELFRRGLSASNVIDLTVRSYRYKGSSPNATPDPGQNPLIINSIVNGKFLLIDGDGGEEHAIRVGGDSLLSMPSYNLDWGKLNLRRPGQSAFKVWNGRPGIPIRKVRIAELDTTDAGYYKSKNGLPPGYNDFNAMLENMVDVEIGRFSAKPELSSYCGYDALHLAGMQDTVVQSATAVKPVRNSVTITPYCSGASLPDYPDGTLPADVRNINVPNLVSVSPGLDHVSVLEVPGYATDKINVRMDAEGGRDAVNWTGDGVTGGSSRNVFEVDAQANLGRSIYTGPHDFDRFQVRNLKAPPLAGQELIGAGRYVGTLTRSGVASTPDGVGGFLSVPADVPRLLGSERRLQIEGGRTNLLLNSATLATQTVTVVAGTHTLSFSGAGTVVLSGAATQTIVGVAGKRSQRVFTASAGALTLTVTGEVRFAQLENAATATSWIPSTGAAGVRGTDLLAIPLATYFPSKIGTLLFSVLLGQRATSGNDQMLFSWHDTTTANRLLFSNAAGSSNLALFNVAGGVTSLANIVVGTMTPGQRIKGALAWDDGAIDVYLDGGAVQTFSVPNAINAWTTLQVGNAQNGAINRAAQGEYISVRGLPYRGAPALLPSLVAGLR